MVRNRNLGSLTLDFSSINPEDIRSARFDVIKNVEEAKRLLEAYDDNRVKKFVSILKIMNGFLMKNLHEVMQFLIIRK